MQWRLEWLSYQAVGNGKSPEVRQTFFFALRRGDVVL